MLHIKEKRRNLSSTQNKSIGRLINDADRVVIGAGAGLSAAAGLDYNSEEFFAKLYPSFYKKGFKTISEAIRQHWEPSESNQLSYWGFWANHIQTIYYEQDLSELYESLYDALEGKDYFIITTNADGQFFKGKFDPDRVFAMQGSYGKFQCQHGCHEAVYDNKAYIEKMIEGFDEATLEIREEDVPKCPVCGGLLSPNLRVNQYFVNGTNMDNRNTYGEFVTVTDEKIVYLELGVGYNTPGIIRYPFEEMVMDYKHAHLIRVNALESEIPDELKEKSVSKAMDIGLFLKELREDLREKGPYDC